MTQSLRESGSTAAEYILFIIYIFLLFFFFSVLFCFVFPLSGSINVHGAFFSNGESLSYGKCKRAKTNTTVMLALLHPFHVGTCGSSAAPEGTLLW